MGIKNTSHIIIKKNSKDKDVIINQKPLNKIYLFNFTKEYIREAIRRTENTPETKEIKNILFNIIKPGGSIYNGKYQKKGCFEILEPIFSDIYDDMIKKEKKYSKRTEYNPDKIRLNFHVVKKRNIDIGDYSFGINYTTAYNKDDQPDLESEYNYISLSPIIKGKYQQPLGGTIRVHRTGLIYLQIDTGARSIPEYMDIYGLSLYYMMYQPEDLKDMLESLVKKGKILQG